MATLTARTGTVQVGGNTVLFVPVNSLGVREDFEDQLVDDSRRLLWKQRKDIISDANPGGFISGDDWEQDRIQLQRDINSFVYSWGTQTWANAYNSDKGQRRILAAMIRLADPRQQGDEIVQAIFDLPDDEKIKVFEHMLQWGLRPNSNGAENPDSSAPTK